MNRSYLYLLDALPDEDGVNIVALSESEANIPLIYRILVSVNPKATQSILFGDKEKIAITADFAEGLKKLESYFSKLPQKYKTKIEQVLEYLRNGKQQYIHLECAEIYEMEEGKLEEQNTALIAELSDIDKAIEKSLEQIKNGDDFDLRELDMAYWQAYWDSVTKPIEADGNDDEERAKTKAKDYKTARAVASIVIFVIAVLLLKLFHRR
ncbi:MAG: hypothetical protein K6F69_06840 [Treponema sp.]|nr:hypothetical protein [Treponema sp.]